MLQFILGVAVIVSNEAVVDAIRRLPSSSVLDTSYHRGRRSLRSASRNNCSSSSSYTSIAFAMHRHRRRRDEQSLKPKFHENVEPFFGISGDYAVATRSSLHIILSSTNGGNGFSGDFYDDFESFGELGGGSSSESNNNIDSNSNDNNVMDAEYVSSAGSNGGDGDMMRDLRARMNDLSRKKEDNNDDEEEEEDDREYEDSDTGSALRIRIIRIYAINCMARRRIEYRMANQ